MVAPPPRIIPNGPDVLSVVREHPSRHPECREWDAHDLARTLRLPEAEVEYAGEALIVAGEALA